MSRITLSSAACLAVQYLSTLSHNLHDFRKTFIENNICFDFLYNFEIFLILRGIHRDTNIKVKRSSNKVAVIFIRFS
jgi:hypothetical protein